MTTDPIIIIGAGQCGLKAAETLRQKGYEDGLMLIGDEPHAPYQRPPLSKAFLKGELPLKGLMLKGSDFFEKFDIDARLSCPIQSIDPAARTISPADAEPIAYSRLLLATGTRSRRIPVPGLELDNVFYMRTIADVEAITAALALVPTSRVTIIGGGYIGLEVASALRSFSSEVTVVEGMERVLQRVVSPQMSAYFHNLHTGHGVNILVNARLEALEGDGSVERVRLGDGQVIETDMVLMAVGAEPVCDLAADAGVKINNGIETDTDCLTSDPHIYAAGDCASFYSARYDRHIRLESVQNAIDQGKHAANAMLGTKEPYDPVPWFWSDQYEIKLQIAGLSQGYDRTETEGDEAQNSFAVRYYKDDRLICVDAVNMPRAHMMARRELAGQAG
ncbi:NAD(P)/FAD-dependent oxidoreductase [Hoeflea prorocentri]|uniref:FAD-dependent oxidoreductase n=1 Tax=Hoeflea prorocentri TaxID=1922333 RepID=A0A9X3UI83_9HYPH|nr:FAD-dependent oxidoreductase [Hoeflea prorocentri]MCY6381338.1 FAD-dependent oxidoreductase [Hoeflea prorocentri]MDA5399138.1 FAD-dependent oxidoreductase [Hoeflea prorocentri]